MKKVIYTLITCLSCCLFSACGEDDNTDYTWKDANEAAFNALESNPDYKKAEIPNGPGFVYYKVLQESTIVDPVKPFYTSVVRVNYRGRLYNGAIFEDALVKPITFKIDGGNFYLNGGSVTGISVITGWRIALQNMKEGEKWEVHIPWELGYGATGSGNIPGYTTLIFEIELEKIVQLYPLPQGES